MYRNLLLTKFQGRHNLIFSRSLLLAMTTCNESTSWYYTLKEAAFIIEKYEGPLSLTSLKNLKKRQSKDPSFNKNFHLLSDIRETQLKIQLEDIKQYQSFVSRLDVIGDRKLAILTNSPMQVAIASLFKSHLKSSGQEIEIFSTLEAAIHWLDRDASYEEVKNLLNSKVV